MFELKLFIATVGLVFTIKLIYAFFNKTFPFSLKIKNDKINSKLQQIIEEANLEKNKIENEKRLIDELAIEKEKERLLKDDFIYELIRKSIINGKWVLFLSDNNYYDQFITIRAINLIPGLKAQYSYDCRCIVVTY